jgi:hypothetical protein
MKSTIPFLFVVMLLLLSCGKKSDPGPSNQLLLNRSIETDPAADTTNWYTGGNGFYSALWSTGNSSSGSHSLSISSIVASEGTFAFWGQHIKGELPLERDVVFSIKLKAVDLAGTGVSIVVRGDGTYGVPIQTSTTEHITNISGTFDWVTYSVKLAPVNPGVVNMYVFIVYLPSTTGTIYADEASLTYY